MTNSNVGMRLDPAENGVARAAEMLRAGQLVAIPTETVYGLAARADSAAAVAAIYRAKGRPDFNPLIVHVADFSQAAGLAQFDDRARRLVQMFWPGPLTLVLPLLPGAPVAAAVTAGLPTLAVRMPAHDLALRVLAETGTALAAPSANRSNDVSPTQVAHVRRSLGANCPAILDGGACRDGLESTIVGLRAGEGWQILRPGPIAADALAAFLGPPSCADTTRIEAPGQLASHYSPGKPIRLAATCPDADEFMIGFGAIAGDCTMSADGDLAVAAARFYDCLHTAAASSLRKIAIAPIPHIGMGIAINDRLRRAAAG